MRVSLLLAWVLLTGCEPQVRRSGAGGRAKPPAAVTVRYWSESARTFRSVEGVPAARQNMRDAGGRNSVRWLLPPVVHGVTHPPLGSEIVEADGTAWVVRRMERPTTACTVCYVVSRAEARRVAEREHPAG